MIFTKGRFKGKSIFEVDPYYAIHYVEQEKGIEHLKEEIKKQLQLKVDAYIHESAPLLKVISHHMMMSKLIGNYRGIIFLQSIKTTIEKGSRIYPNAFRIISDILSRGYNIKPWRRNSKKYKSVLEEIERYRSIVVNEKD